MGLGAEIAALASESALDDLRAPVLRIAMPDVAGIPASGPQEDFLIPDRARIAAALRDLTRVDRAQRRAISANGVVEAQPRAVATEAPQAASVVEIDLTRVAQRIERDRATWAQRQVEPSTTAFFAEALLAALSKVPQANAAFAGDGIQRHTAVH